MKKVEKQIRHYLTTCDEDLGEWNTHAMAEELATAGIRDIKEMEADDFIGFLQEWEGKVVDYYGGIVDFEAAMSIADQEICEKINSCSVRSNQEYFNRYAKMHAKKYNGEEFAPFYHLPW